MSNVKIWGFSILAGLLAAIFIEFLVILFLYANFFITGEMLSGEGSVDLGVAILIGPILSLVVGYITIWAVKTYLAQKASGS